MDDDYTFKMILVGNTGVGKTSILYKFINSQTTCMNTSPTIGIDFGTKRIVMENNTIKLNIWDTAGLERYRAITRSYFRNIAGAVIIFDLTNINSFKNIPKWKEEIMRHSNNKRMQFILVGNKCDLQNKIVVTDRDISDMSLALNIDFVKTSVLDCHNINYIFEKLSCKVYHNCKQINKLLLSEDKNPADHLDRYGIRYNQKKMDTLVFCSDKRDNDSECESDDNGKSVCRSCVIN